MEGSKTRIPDDLENYLPRVLWLYQMGLILFWVYDSSPGQSQTELLFDKRLAIVVGLIKFSSFRLMHPLRKMAADLLGIVYDQPEGLPEITR
jgi:Tetracyclin repressor-like, C-terminal domain